MIEINNLTTASVNKELLRRVAKKVLKGENKKGDLSIVLVKPEIIKKLNKKYRKKNEVTDILSFSLNNRKERKIVFPPEIKKEIGELVICPKEVKKNARQFKTTFREELNRVLIHGILHLLGYEHKKSEKDAKIMRKKEDYYFEAALKFNPN